MTDLHALPAVELAWRIRRRELGSLEVVEAHIARIERVNPAIGALVAEDFAGARRAARAIDAAPMPDQDERRLLGVPFTVKELIAVAGMPWTAGVVARRGVVAGTDAPLVARLRAAGAIFLGVTNVSEAGLWLETHNKVYGQTSNPHDLGHIPGGSTGGEAALIAAGGSPMGVGADIGGSIRNPSFFCGIAGHKPTGQLLPSTGHWPPAEGARGRHCVSGPMARTIRDLEAMMEVMSPEVDPHRAPGRARFRRLEGVTPADVRVSYFLGNGLTRVDPELRAASLALLERMRAHGFVVSEWKPPDLAWSPAIWGAMVAATADSSVAELIGNGARVPLAREWLGALFGRAHHPLYTLIMATLEGLTQTSPQATASLLARASRIRAAVEERLGPRGVLVCLPYPRPAPRHHVPLLSPLAFSECGIWNALEMPATAVPIGRSRTGLPLGVQVVARRFDDPVALWVAARIEELSPPFAPVCPAAL